MTSEIQRIPDPEASLVEDPWESCISEWETGVSQELLGALRQMRAAYYVREAYGRAGVEKFAREVNAKKSKVYAYGATFEALAEHYQSNVSRRLESSPLSPWGLVAAVKRGVQEGDVEASLGRAEQGETYREITESTNGKGELVAHTMACPRCGGTGEIPMEKESV